MKVICISGKAQHGKDTVANMLKSILEDEGNSVLIAHYADLVKYICITFFDWDGEKDNYGRSLLQRVGTDIVRAQRPDYWVTFIAGILELFPEEWDYVLIPDCRFPNEINYIKNAGFDAIHLRVVRENFESPLTQEQQDHPSETALDGVKPDRYIYNNGTLEGLQREVREFAGALSGGDLCA